MRFRPSTHRIKTAAFTHYEWMQQFLHMIAIRSAASEAEIEGLLSIRSSSLSFIPNFIPYIIPELFTEFYANTLPSRSKTPFFCISARSRSIVRLTTDKTTDISVAETKALLSINLHISFCLSDS